MNGYNPSQSTWMNPNIEYLFSEDIIEYDIHDAGYSLIKQFHLLPDDKIKQLSMLAKGIDRHVAVGKLQRDDREFSKLLTSKFAEVRQIFLTTNQISSDDIVSVKKDAIYTIGEQRRTRFGIVQFAQKNRYTSYIRFPNIQNIELYYSQDKLDVKGMGDSAINRHRLYMMEFFNELIPMIESRNPYAKRFLIRFIMRYKSHELDDEYYLEFNNMSRDINPLFNYLNILIPLVRIIHEEIRQ